MSHRSVVAVASLVAVLAASVGLGVGLAVAPTPLPDVIAEQQTPSTVEVTARDVDDSRTVAAEAKVSQSRSYTSRAAGVLRSSSCTAGKRIRSGDSVAVVNGSKVVALHLARPPWRSLTEGDQGDDVRDVQQELTRLGYAVTPDGRYSKATSRAVTRFWEAVGVEKLADLPIEQLVWLSKASVVPTSCAVGVGSELVAGDTVFTTGGRLTALTLTVPTTAVPGKRVAVLDSVTAKVSSRGVIKDTGFLAAFEAGRTYRDWSADPQSTTLTVATRLRAPVQAAAVPASALYDVTDLAGCVLNEGEPLQVVVVASELGSTFVTADPLPTKVAVPAPSTAASCG